MQDIEQYENSCLESEVNKEKGTYPEVEFLEDYAGQQFLFYHILEPQWLDGHYCIGLSDLSFTSRISYAIVECLYLDKDKERMFPGFYKITREQFFSGRATCDGSANTKSGKTVPLMHFFVKDLQKVKFPSLSSYHEIERHQESLDPKFKEDIQLSLQKLREGKRKHASNPHSHSLSDNVWRD